MNMSKILGCDITSSNISLWVSKENTKKNTIMEKAVLNFID